jgi:hypothetical protein
MPSEEEIKEQQELLIAYRRTLFELLRQRALITATFVPPGIAINIQDSRDQIRSIKKNLRAWGVTLDDYPYDEEILSSPPEPIGKVHLGSADTTKSSHTGWYIGALVIVASLSIASLVLFLRTRPETSTIASTAAPPTAAPIIAHPQASVTGHWNIDANGYLGELVINEIGPDGTFTGTIHYEGLDPEPISGTWDAARQRILFVRGAQRYTGNLENPGRLAGQFTDPTIGRFDWTASKSP